MTSLFLCKYTQTSFGKYVFQSKSKSSLILLYISFSPLNTILLYFQERIDNLLVQKLNGSSSFKDFALIVFVYLRCLYNE